MGQWLNPEDLDTFASISAEQADFLIKHAESLARVVAPCLKDTELDPDQVHAIAGILSAAVLRWHEAGLGAVTQQSAGPFQQSVDARVQRMLFWPAEIRNLSMICSPNSGKAFTVDLAQRHDGDLFAQRPDLRFQWG